MLAFIFQQSIDTGEVPQDWRTANIVPIFKKGNRSKPANYRPVSLTAIPCKIMEHIISSQMMDHLEENNILLETQHGFRHKRSCESQLIITTDDLSRVLNTHGQTDMAILDFSKAFDKVPHARLAQKLEFYGIRGKTKQWIISFLRNRSQRVLVDGDMSQLNPVISGVPQGTVLGPILFLIYINDISDNIDSTVRLFADDCLVYREIKSVEDCQILQRDLDTIYNWSQTWLMDFNVSKCYFMSVTLARNKIDVNYSMDGKYLSRTKVNPYLGVEISYNLNWSPQVDKICNKANKILGLLRRNLHHTPRTIKQDSYKMMVRPILEYSSTVWSPWQQKNIAKLEGIQKRAARFVLKKPNYLGSQDSITTLIRDDLKWETLEERRNKNSLTMLYKVVNHQIAVPPPYHPTPATRTTRTGPHTLMKYQPTVNAYKFSFFPRAVTLWNNIPSQVASSPSIEEFKSGLQKLTF